MGDFYIKLLWSICITSALISVLAGALAYDLVKRHQSNGVASSAAGGQS